MREHSNEMGTGVPPRQSLVLDFDGTITLTDTLEMIVGRFGDPRVRQDAEARMGDDLALADVLALAWSTVRASMREVATYLDAEVEFRPGLKHLVAVADQEGWPVRVVSSGAASLIGPLLAREGLGRLEIRANEVEPNAVDGWRLLPRRLSVCGACGEPCKRDLLPSGSVIYAGDGYSDLCAALAAHRVFARRRLAEELDRNHVPYDPLADFHQVAESLVTRREATDTALDGVPLP
jgi:2-hydroxy-3-keto-5-methylthiopentenyl-1-phosphate phosphatase